MSKYTSEDQIPYGFCHCGCGQKTDIATRNNTNGGYIKGKPKRYINYHHQRFSKSDFMIAFWSKVLITADDNQCWEWTAFCHPTGYGLLKLNRKSVRAHRIAWSYPDYVIPDGMFICHSCDNPACCNPKHLFLGTGQDNTDDMIAKGRGVYAKGEQAGLARLTAEQVCEIRQRFALGGISQGQLARDYNIGRSTIGHLLARRTWKHLP